MDHTPVILSTMLDMFSSFEMVLFPSVAWMDVFFCLPADCKHGTELERGCSALVGINPDHLPPSLSDLWTHHFV